MSAGPACWEPPIQLLCWHLAELQHRACTSRPVPALRRAPRRRRRRRRLPGDQPPGSRRCPWPQGYLPGDLYNLNSKYGSEAELIGAVRALQAHGIKVLGDAVLNHRCAQHQDENGARTGGGRAGLVAGGARGRARRAQQGRVGALSSGAPGAAPRPSGQPCMGLNSTPRLPAPSPRPQACGTSMAGGWRGTSVPSWVRAAPCWGSRAARLRKPARAAAAAAAVSTASRPSRSFRPLSAPLPPPPGDDPNFRGRGNRSSGDIFPAAPNIDHSQEFVKRDLAGAAARLRGGAAAVRRRAMPGRGAAARGCRCASSSNACEARA